MSNLLSLSNCTVIGYSYKDEMIKDELISNISYKEIEVNSSSFSLKKTIRDIKIDSLFGVSNNNITHLLLDLNSISYRDKDDVFAGYNRGSFIKEIVKNIKQELTNTEYKLILTTSISRNLGYIKNDTHRLNGGQEIMYISDLVYMIVDGEIKIVKNRYENRYEEYK